MPATEVLRHPLVNTPRTLDDWSDEDIRELANHFSVSKEAILRRLLTLQRTSRRFYERKRDQFIEEAQQASRRTGFAHPAVNTLSLLGKPYVSLVLNAYNSKTVTASDASDYLGLRAKHFNRLADSLRGE
jgi:Zn-dependent peptidase ImmA (M78 family)